MQGERSLADQASTHVPDGERREARAQRILDAASHLILRYGYHRTSMEDIAREAGVGKGTLYLHWKTREALFADLILREKVAMATQIQESIKHDPEGATVRGLLRQAALALLKRPLLKAVLLRETEVFGKLVEREQGSATSTEVFAGFMAYLQGLGEQGLLRRDLSQQAQVTLFSSIFLGFLLAAPLLPGAFKPSEEELAELIAEAGHRTLEPCDPGSVSARMAASHSLTQYLDRSVARAQEQLGDGGQMNREDEPARLMVRPRGRQGGRSKKLKTATVIAEARRMHADKSRSIDEICAALGISRATFYRYLKDGKGEEA